MRVLKNDGFFLYITYRNAMLMKSILGRNNDWDIQTETISDGVGFEYFGYILKKQKNRI